MSRATGFVKVRHRRSSLSIMSLLCLMTLAGCTGDEGSAAEGGSGGVGGSGIGGAGGAAGAGGEIPTPRCAPETPEGTCPEGRRCDGGACIVDNLNTDPLPAGVDPVATFEKIWEIYDRNYAAFPIKSLDWDEVKTRYGAEAAGVTTRGELYWLLARAVNEIGDGHTYTYHPEMTTIPTFNYAGSNTGACATRLENGALVVYKLFNQAPAGLAAGDEILAFGDRSAAEALFDLDRQPRAFIAASTPAQYEDRLALSIFARAVTDTSVTVRHVDGTEETIPLSPTTELSSFIRCNGVVGPAAVNSLGNGVVTADLPSASPGGIPSLYLRFPFFGSYDAQGNFVDEPILATLRQVFDDAVIEQRPGIVIDLRDNGGGYVTVYLSLASYLLGVPTDLFRCKNRNPAQPGDAYFAPYVLSSMPDPQIQYTGKVAVLVSSQSFSAADFTSYFLRATGRARLFGHPSGGGFGSGNVVPYPADPAWTLGVNNTFCETLDGTPLEGNPPPVDEPVSYTQEDLAKGRDTVLEAARAWVNAP